MAKAIEHRTITAYATALKPSAEALNNILTDITMAGRASQREGFLKLALPLTALVVFLGSLGFLLRDKFVAVPIAIEERKIEKDLQKLEETENIVEQVEQLDKDLRAIDKELEQLEDF